MRKAPPSPDFDSPFFSRAYGGYTRKQQEFILSALVQYKTPRRILDPMAGQAYALSALSGLGHQVWAGDLNPAPLVLASLRSSDFARHRSELVHYVRETVSRVARRRRPQHAPRFIEDWLPPSIRQDLVDYAELLGINIFNTPYSFSQAFWSLSLESRFAVAISVLAARQLTCFRRTDNLTWLKPGGLPQHLRFRQPISQALNVWSAYVDDQQKSSLRSTVTLNRMNAELGIFGSCPQVDFIVTSPPYANRLDYTRLWAPESQVLAALANGSVAEIQDSQIGTTTVALRGVPELSVPLPEIVEDALQEIRADPAPYSSTYYFPFFRNYAASMQRMLQHLQSKVSPKGEMLIFVRDTARKDVLFPTGRLVTETILTSDMGFTLKREQRQIIRQHVGYRRRSTTRGLYGLAQQEWWLRFQRDK